MPLRVAREVQVRPGFAPWQSLLMALAAIAIMLLCIFCFVGLAMTVPFESVLRGMSIIPEDTIAIDVEQFWVVGSAFAGIMAMGVIANLISACHRGLAIKTAITSIRQYSARTPSGWMYYFPGGAIRRIDPQLEPDDYLAAYPLADSRLAGKGLMIVLLLMMPCFVWDGFSATCVRPHGVSVGSRFGLRSETIPWSDIERVATGCYRKSKMQPTPVYKLYLPDNVIVDIGDVDLSSLAVIDQHVRTHQIPWERAKFDAGTLEGRTQWRKEAFQLMHDRLKPADWRTFAHVFRLSEWLHERRNDSGFRVQGSGFRVRADC